MSGEKDHSGPSSFEVSNQMQQGSASHGQTSSGSSVHGANATGMFPLEGNSIDTNLGSVDSALSMSSTSMEGLFGKLNAGNALGKSITDDIGGIVSHKFTAEATGDQGLDLKNLGKGERATPPTIQGDLQMKNVGMVGQDGGAQH